MGLISPNTTEINLLRDMFLEAGYLHGHEAIITIYTSYTDGDAGSGVMGDPLTFSGGIFFEENPSVKLLKSLGWYVEDEEILPSIVYIPAKYDDRFIFVRPSSKITVRVGDTFLKDYKISSVKSPYVNPVFYTCKLIPWFESEPTNQSGEDSTFDSTEHEDKYNFFNTEKLGLRSNEDGSSGDS